MSRSTKKQTQQSQHLPLGVKKKSAERRCCYTAFTTFSTFQALNVWFEVYLFYSIYRTTTTSARLPVRVGLGEVGD
jgi:hypothetical protein